LEEVDDAYRPLGGEKLAEMVAVGLGLVEPLQQPPIKVGDDEGQVGAIQYYVLDVKQSG
jgi:hypothetical protein